MTGGSSFNEVYLDDVFVPDTDRLGPVGEGLAGDADRPRRRTPRLRRPRPGQRRPGARPRPAAPRPLTAGRTAVVRRPVRCSLVQRLIGLRVTAALAAGREPGAEASVGKLHATATLRATTDLVEQLLGPRLAADTGERAASPGPSTCSAHPAIASRAAATRSSGSILAERVLGLPKESKRVGR